MTSDLLTIFFLACLVFFWRITFIIYSISFFPKQILTLVKDCCFVEQCRVMTGCFFTTSRPRPTSRGFSFLVFWRSGGCATEAASSSRRPLGCLSTDETISQKLLLQQQYYFSRHFLQRCFILLRADNFHISKGDFQDKIGLERVTTFSLRTNIDFFRILE